MMILVRQPRPRANGAPFVAIAAQGVVVGIITGLVGVGGGFLIVPALVLLMGLPIASAVPTSLAIIAMNAAVGFLKYQNVLQTHDLAVNWVTVATFIALGVVGSLAGSAAAGRLNPAILRRIFAVFLILMAGYILYRETPRLISPGRTAAAEIQSFDVPGTSLPRGASKHGRATAATLGDSA
jgi:uncharacterized protein